MNSLPYVRCVGIGDAIYQQNFKKAYDSRLICVMSGEGAVEIADEKYRAVQGSVFIITPGTKYRVRSGKNQKIAVINFDTDYSFSHIEEPVLSVDEKGFVADEILKCESISFLTKEEHSIGSSDLDLFEELYRIYLREDMDRQIRSFALSAKLAYIISKIITQGEKTEGISADIYKYIVDNACEKLTAEGVAKKFNYSASYIEKLLRKNYNISFRQLIIETRLKKALWLLENTSMSCSEISSSLGFYSAQHFTQMFRKKYNLKPTDLR